EMQVPAAMRLLAVYFEFQYTRGQSLYKNVQKWQHAVLLPFNCKFNGRLNAAKKIAKILDLTPFADHKTVVDVTQKQTRCVEHRKFRTAFDILHYQICDRHRHRCSHSHTELLLIDLTIKNK